MSHNRPRLAVAVIWAATAATILELCAREVARRSLFGHLTPYTPGPVALVVVVVAAALLLSSAARFKRRERTALLFSVLFAVGLALQLQLGARLQSDGFYYFAYLRSIAFDGDVDFTNDYKLLGLEDKPALFIRTPTGYAQSAASIGPALLWSPFFAAGHLVAKSLSARHPEVDANGISFPYRQAVCVAGLFYGLLGCWFCFRLARKFYGSSLAALATALTVGGSFLLWYLVKEPSMTHGPSMASVAAFSWTWIATREARAGNMTTPGSRGLRAWAWLGAVAGLMTLIRWQNALFAILPALDALGSLVAAARRSDRVRLRGVLAGGTLFVLCATLAFTPQMLAWRSIYGSWLAVSPLGPQIRWTGPQLVDILWSSRNGLFSWSPVLYAGAIGLVMFAVMIPSVGGPMLLAVVLMTYFNACIQDWWGSDGFGGRRFDGTLPFLCIGVAAVASYAVSLTRRHPVRAVAAAGLGFVIWNFTLMGAAEDGAFRLGTSVSFGETGAAQARAFHRWFGSPFTYPASLFFAIRNDLPPGRYDLLSANRFLSEPLRQYGRIEIGAEDEWVLEGGWHAAEREGPITFRWAYSPAVVLIPLDHPAALALKIRLHAFSYPGWTKQTLTLTINNHDFGPMPVDKDWGIVEFATEAGVWHGGVNRLWMKFESTRSPAEAGLSGDTRQLAAAVDYVRFTVQ